MRSNTAVEHQPQGLNASDGRSSPHRSPPQDENDRMSSHATDAVEGSCSRCASELSGSIEDKPPMSAGADEQLPQEHQDMPESTHGPEADKESSLRASPEPSSPSVEDVPVVPKPRGRPKGPRTSWTSDEDAKLRRLRDRDDMSWREIAPELPGRTAGACKLRHAFINRTPQEVRRVSQRREQSLRG